MANDDYQGITFINHSSDSTNPSKEETVQRLNTEEIKNEKSTLITSDRKKDMKPNQTLEDTFLTVQELNERLLALEKAFFDYREETAKKFEHLEKRVKAGNRSLSERILEIQEDS